MSEDEKKKPEVPDALKAAMKRTLLAEARIEAFDFVTRGMFNSRLYIANSDSLRGASSTIRAQLHQEASSAHRDLLMFTMMEDDPKATADLMEFIRQRYFGGPEQFTHKAVMQYLNTDVRADHPGRWWSEDEESLRKSIEDSIDKLVGKTKK